VERIVGKLLLIQVAAGGLDIAGELAAVLGGGGQVEYVHGVDRQKLEMALGRAQYEAVHVFGHGGVSVLECTDGLMSEAEFVTLIEGQRGLRFVLLSACDSYEMAGAVHNALHVPVISYGAPIEDRAAIEFARGFYRHWTRAHDVGQAVERGREALAVLFPGEARKVRLIDGDGVTPSEFREVVQEMRAGLAGLDARMARIEKTLERGPRAWVAAVFVLLVLLVIAQVGTPFLNAALIHLAP
jgi:hypothetical protein